MIFANCPALQAAEHKASKASCSAGFPRRSSTFLVCCVLPRTPGGLVLMSKGAFRPLPHWRPQHSQVLLAPPSEASLNCRQTQRVVSFSRKPRRGANSGLIVLFTGDLIRFFSHSLLTQSPNTGRTWATKRLHETQQTVFYP